MEMEAESRVHLYKTKQVADAGSELRSLPPPALIKTAFSLPLGLSLSPMCLSVSRTPWRFTLCPWVSLCYVLVRGYLGGDPAG